MPISPNAIANAFLALARAEDKTLTNRQVQKLVFLAQGYSLALLERCIYENNTHAWQWGPVVPKLYKALQRYGSGIVTEDLNAQDSVVHGSEDYEIVAGVWDAYGMYSGSQLSALTHKEGSPWAKQWALKPFDPIPVSEIKSYYKELVKQ